MEFLLLITAAPGTPLVVAGGMGGITRWLYVILLDKKMAVGQGVATIVLGAILGYYISPNLVGTAGWSLSAFAIDQDKLPIFTAFSTGVGGVGVVGLILDLVASWRKKLIPEASVVLNPKPTGDGP